MRVLHVAETITGGVATIMRHLVAAQVESPAITNVRVLVPANQVDALEDACPEEPYTFKRTGRHVIALARFFVVLCHTLWRTRPHVVHLHSTYAGLVARPLLFILRPFLRPKVVYCPHGWAFSMDVSGCKKNLYARLEYILSHVTDAVICVSRYEYQVAADVGIPPQKLEVIVNGVPIPEQLQQKHKPQDAPLHLLFLGRFDRQKGFDVLLEAMAQLEDALCHLTAAGSPVQDEIHPPGRPNITYTGWVPSAEVSALLMQTDVLIMPSRWEGFGLVAAEAMSFGIPVLATDVCALPELVIHNKTGRLVPVNDAEAIASTVQQTPRAAWQRMGLAARAHVLKNFQASRMAAQTLALYERITIR